MSRETITFRLKPEIIRKLRKLAERDNRTPANYVETLILRQPEPKGQQDGKGKQRN